jgi:cell fate (sporulation/competence/biofilm development) regulator YlbF (YheA/YmcA/DUF963 family)
MEILNKARELGALIADSDKMKDLKDSEAAVAADQKAQDLLSDYKELQVEVVRATKEKKDKDFLDNLKSKLMEKQKEVNEYEATKNYMNALNNFDNFMKTINDVIIYSISGEEPCSPNKCGSCGGGCK